VALLATVGGSMAARPLFAQGLHGSFQAQFQRFERPRLVANADGTYRTELLTRELWVQTWDFNHQAYLKPQLLLQSTFRYTDLAYLRQPEASRSPYTSVRLTHPWFGVFGSHQPSATTGLMSRDGVGAPTDTSETVEVTSRTQDTSVGGNLGAPGWPRLDVAWTRRHRDRDAIATEATSVQRFARMTWDRGALSLHGSLGDQRREGEVASRAGVLTQQNLSAGGSYRVAPWRATSFQLMLDLSDARNPRPGGRDLRSRSQSASLSGERRETEKLIWNLNYFLRRTSSNAGGTASPADHDGSLVLNYSPSRAVRLTGGGGARTSRLLDDQRMTRYVTAVASANGRVREHWTGAASASHTTQWDPFRGVTNLETVQLNSQLRLIRGLSADANLQVSSQSDSAAHAEHSTRDLSLRVQAAPLRSLSIGLAERHFQVGSGLTVASGRSRTTTLDARWVPVRSVEVIGSHGVSGTLPDNRPRVTTDMANLRLSLASKLQLTGTWSRSAETRADASANPLSGREIATARMVAALSGSLSVNAGFSVAERGTPRESRQYDAAVVMGFRR
jgi:hypothetical protein